MPKLVLDKPKRQRLVLDEPEDEALYNDPNDVTVRAVESLGVADNLELPLIQAEEIADTLDGQKLERPGLFKRGVFGFVNKAVVQPFKNIIKGGGVSDLDAALDALGEIRKIKEETGREISGEEFVEIIQKSRVKVEKRVQAGLPGLQLPAAEGVTEKGLEIATGLGAFITRLVMARKFVGGKGVGAEIAAFEAVNQVDNGPPGLGILLAGSLGLIGKVPAATLGGKGLKLAGQGGALATVTAARGGEPEDVAVAFFLPAILQTFNQFPHLIKGKAWDIKTAKGAKELGMFKGVPLKNIKQWSAAMRDAAKVKAGTMTPKKWGAKHGKNLEDFSNKIGKTYDDVVKITGEVAKPAVPPSKAVKKAPSKPVKAKAPVKAKITPVKAEGEVEIAPKAAKKFEEREQVELAKKQTPEELDAMRAEARRRAVEQEVAEPAKVKGKTPEQRTLEEIGPKPSGMYNLAEQKAWEKKYWATVSRYAAKEKPPTPAKAEPAYKIGKKTTVEKKYFGDPRTYEWPGNEIALRDYPDEKITVYKTKSGWLVGYGKGGAFGKEREGGGWRGFDSKQKAIKSYIKEKLQPVSKEKPPKVKKSKLLTEKEKRDILGGVDPINQIHIALKAAKAVRPITEAAKKEALRKRVGAAAGALRAGLKRGMPAEQAILKSTGLLKGPLTEYDQIYESIEDTLEPGAKDAAYNMIATHPDLRYFEVVNTQKSFQKLLAGSDLTPKDAENIERVFGKVLDDIVKPRTKKSDLYDRAISIWKAGLLTGIKTHGLNLLANTTHSMTETAKDIPAAFVDSVASLFTKERTLAFTARGIPGGAKEGFDRGWKYLRTGMDERNIGAKLDYKRVNFGTGRIARGFQAYEETIFHLLGAADQPFYYGAKARSLYSQVIAQAINKGLKGKDRIAYVNNAIQNPTNDMLEYAVHDAEVAVFQNRTHLGDIAKSIQKVKGGEVIVPFGRTPSAVAMQIVNYSPIGPVKEVAEQIHKGKFNQKKFSQAFGRATVGTGALFIGGLLLRKGLITLDYPDNERERELWKLEGRQANSILIDGKWRTIQTLGPVGNVLIIGGHFDRELKKEGSPTKAIVTALAGGAKSFSEQTFVRGVNLAVDAITSPERSFENWFTSMAGSVVPTIVADIARAQDDISRRAIGVEERIKTRIPGLRKDLEPAIDVFGQDLPRYGGNVLETMADPTRPSKIRQDIVVDELRRLWDKDIKVAPTLLGDKAGYDILTKEENTQLWRRAGELIYKGLFAAINSEGYESTNDFAKGKLLDLVTRNAKATAKLEIVIIKKAQGKTIMQLAESGLFTVEEFEMLKYFQSTK